MLIQVFDDVYRIIILSNDYEWFLQFFWFQAISKFLQLFLLIKTLFQHNL